MHQKPHITSLRQLPALRLLLLCCAGMCAGFFLPTAPILSFSALALVGGFLVLGGKIVKKNIEKDFEKKLLERQTALSRTVTTRFHTATVLAYTCAAFALGALVAKEAESTRLDIGIPDQTSIIAPQMPTVLRGEILRILRRDSLSTRLLVRGIVDTKAFPRLHDATVLLTVRPAASKHPMTAVMDDLRAGTSIYAVVSARIPRRALLPTDIDEAYYAASLSASLLAQTDMQHLAITAENRTFQTFLDKAARALEHRITTLFPAETAPFALALLTGNTAHLDLATKHAYSRTGTIHIAAVSGLHLSLVVAIVLVPLAFVRRPHVRWFLAVVAIAAFVLFTGAAASAMRSGAMAALLLLTFAEERRAVLLNVVALSVVLVLVWQPAMVYSIGFRMSAAAVFGIALLLPLFEQGFMRLLGIRTPRFANDFPVRKRLAQMLAVTSAASVASVPISAWYFETTSLVALPANLVVVPLSSVAMLYTLASVAFSTFWQGGAELFAQTAHQSLHLMNSLNTIAAAPRFAAIEGRWAFGVAVGLSFGMVYGASALSWRIFAFRFVVLALAASALVLILRDTSTQATVQILPREQVVAALVPCRRHTFLLLQDRRLEGAAAKPDAALERYVGEYCLAEQDSLTVCTTGAASMLIAARLGTLLANSQAQKISTKPIAMRVLAQSLLYKNPRFFAALDTLEAHSIRVLSATAMMKRDSTVLLREEIPHKQRIVWDIWQGRLLVSDEYRNRNIVLPQVRTMQEW